MILLLSLIVSAVIVFAGACVTFGVLDRENLNERFYDWKPLEWIPPLGYCVEFPLFVFLAFCFGLRMLISRKCALLGHGIFSSLDHYQVHLQKCAPSFPRVWELIGFLFTHRIRNDVYEPYRNEMLEDYYSSKRFRSRGAKWWLRLCFLWRTVWVVLDCWRLTLSSPLGKWLSGMMPEPIRRWWLG